MGAQSASSNMLQSYYLYSALLAMMVVTMPILSSFCCLGGSGGRINVGDLKQLTPYWLIAALYTTTSPNASTAISLFRMFVASKFVCLLGHMTPTPKCLDEAAYAVSVAIITYMGFQVVVAYKDAF